MKFKIFFLLLIITFFISSHSASAQKSQQELKIWFNKPADNWNELQTTEKGKSYLFIPGKTSLIIN